MPPMRATSAPQQRRQTFSRAATKLSRTGRRPRPPPTRRRRPARRLRATPPTFRVFLPALRLGAGHDDDVRRPPIVLPASGSILLRSARPRARGHPASARSVICARQRRPSLRGQGRLASRRCVYAETSASTRWSEPRGRDVSLRPRLATQHAAGRPKPAATTGGTVRRAGDPHEADPQPELHHRGARASQPVPPLPALTECN